MNQHPENDLTADADFANRRRPEPQTVEELADSPDPVKVAAANRASSRQAWIYLVTVLVGSLVVGLGTLCITRALGGPLCEAGEATWLCTKTQLYVWAVVAALVPFGGLIGCGVIMVKKINGYLRWRPWMGVFWLLVPVAMTWGLAILQQLAPA